MADGQQDGMPMTSSQVQANLTGAKEARKRAELDAQLLANRIALLKQEEEKAWKKIEETRKRASEIIELRKQNEQKFSAKEHFYKQKWESIRSAQVQNSQIRDKAKAIREQTRQGLQEQKHSNAQNTKQQSQHMLLQKKEREAADREANMERSTYLKAKKDDAKRRLDEERLQQLEKFREDYEARTAQEELLRARTDALVAKMEKEEMELIQRLQNTQTVQRNAYEELEAALARTASKYLLAALATSQAAMAAPEVAAPVMMGRVLLPRATP
eukprot:CAMPEP_0115068728 /NCGR_PEP_ID=MMETSP0227-20121206/12144_1 /TAXON_ID=89957 /ORGANISM="Polarella glacialis, Strain CCMP 1383" /LENGTH=271 /DNA_ID=CAMNT_0002455013 /DNA_START=38 /DNA_END=854 /DNA_ORIENTATION=+